MIADVGGGETRPSRRLGSSWNRSAPDLSGCWAKYDRAQEHLTTLRHSIEELPFWTTFVEVSRPVSVPDTASAIDYVCTHVDEPPMRWAVLVGDVVHNLRSALDHLVCQLTLAQGGDCEKPRTAYPITANPATFRKEAKTKLASVSPDAVAFVEALQPYHALDWVQQDGTLVYRHPLRLLERLWNQDKHRLPVLSAWGPKKIVLDDVRLQDAEYVGLSYPRAPYRVGEHAFTVHYLVTGPDPRLDFVFTPTPLVSFDDGEPVLDSLECAAYFVAGVLLEFRGSMT